MKNIKQLLQDEADTKAAIAKLKKEGRTLAAVETPTDEQKARLTAILSTELTALEEQIWVGMEVTVDTEIQEYNGSVSSRVKLGGIGTKKRPSGEPSGGLS
jgi:hypothetical protein